RSLFSFLTSNYEGGFFAFLEEARIQADGTIPLYKLDRLFDFLVATLGPALYTQANGKRWAEVDHVLSKVRADDLLAARIVKTIALLNLFGNRELRASRRVICFALEDANTTEQQVGTAIDALTGSSTLVFRRHADSYALWEGSDIDLEQALATAVGHVQVD